MTFDIDKSDTTAECLKNVQWRAVEVQQWDQENFVASCQSHLYQHHAVLLRPSTAEGHALRR